MTHRFQSLFDSQQEHFLRDASKSHDWRIDQLDRMERMVMDHKEACALRSIRISASRPSSNCLTFIGHWGGRLTHLMAEIAHVLR